MRGLFNGAISTVQLPNLNANEKSTQRAFTRHGYNRVCEPSRMCAIIELITKVQGVEPLGWREQPGV